MVVSAYSRDEILRWLGQVADPEIPVLSITDLGIVRGVEIGERVTIALSPTYSGCPATEVIENSVIRYATCTGVTSPLARWSGSRYGITATAAACW